MGRCQRTARYMRRERQTEVLLTCPPRYLAMETDAGVEGHDFPKCSSAFTQRRSAVPIGTWDLLWGLSARLNLPSSKSNANLRFYGSGTPRCFLCSPSFPNGKFLFAQRNVWFPFPSHGTPFERVSLGRVSAQFCSVTSFFVHPSRA